MLQSVASRDPDTPNPIGVIDGHGKLYTTTAVAVKTTGTTPATLAVTCTGPVWRPSASVVVASPAESVTDAGGCAVATPCVTVQVTTAPGNGWLSVPVRLTFNGSDRLAPMLALWLSPAAITRCLGAAGPLASLHARTMPTAAAHTNAARVVMNERRGIADGRRTAHSRPRPGARIPATRPRYPQAGRRSRPGATRTPPPTRPDRGPRHTRPSGRCPA